jgi:hypothetical protein
MRLLPGNHFTDEWTGQEVVIVAGAQRGGYLTVRFVRSCVITTIRTSDLVYITRQ